MGVQHTGPHALSPCVKQVLILVTKDSSDLGSLFLARCLSHVGSHYPIPCLCIYIHVCIKLESYWSPGVTKAFLLNYGASLLFHVVISSPASYRPAPFHHTDLF